MQKNPLVSIIINCYNGEKYLHKAIKSVLNQNYKHWEIIFFDNNSIDRSSFLLKKYKDKRIKYFKTKKTYPLYKARNLAIKKSKGELISFLDIDDWWLKNKLNKQIKFFLKNKAVDVLYSNTYL
jgi:glycosyltransferase involved in cell wall biosynthesis